jgi:WS/DGAT/MGAT family acyltransferase
VWVPDAEFDFDYHVRWLRLSKPGTERQLFELAAQLYQEPFDRTRPLWRYVMIDGLKGGKSAIYSIVHHVVADGIGQMRMAEMYQQLNRDEAPPPDVDLDAVIGAAAETHTPLQIGGDLGESVYESTVGTVSHLTRRQLGMARRFAEEVVTWPGDPNRAVEKMSDAITAARTTVSGALGSGDDVSGGSPLWATRSRHRQLEAVRAELDVLKRASKRVDASINDLFLAAMVEGAVRYHADRGVEVDAFNTSFVLSTRSDKAAGGNSFTPVPVQLSGQPMSLAERVADVHDRLAVKREQSSHGGGMDALAGVAKLLPTSVVTRAARARAAHQDFATSNLRGAPIPLYVSGAEVTDLVSMGPVAGTAGNATAISYNGGFTIGMFVDPVAIEAPGDFRDAVDEALTDIAKL